MAGAWEREAVCRGKESVSASNARSWVPWGKILTFLYTFTLFTFVFMIFEEYTTAAMHRLPVKSITPLFHYVIYFVLCVYWNWINPFCCYDHDQLFFLQKQSLHMEAQWCLQSSFDPVWFRNSCLFAPCNCTKRKLKRRMILHITQTWLALCWK